jgi:hypothetical protein
MLSDVSDDSFSITLVDLTFSCDELDDKFDCDELDDESEDILLDLRVGVVFGFLTPLLEFSIYFGLNIFLELLIMFL